jgi:hypothetical protein
LALRVLCLYQLVAIIMTRIAMMNAKEFKKRNEFTIPKIAINVT